MYFINPFHSFPSRSDLNFTDIFQERIDGEDQFQQCAKGLGQGQFHWWVQRWCGPTVEFASRGSNGGMTPSIWQAKKLFHWAIFVTGQGGMHSDKHTRKPHSNTYCWWNKCCTSWYGIKDHLQGFIHPWWCRISSINSSTWHWHYTALQPFSYVFLTSNFQPFKCSAILGEFQGTFFPDAVWEVLVPGFYGIGW